MKSYLKHDPSDWARHRDFLKATKCYFVDENKRLYVHGGVDPQKTVDKWSEQSLMWDRDLWDCRPVTCKKYKEVFVGHTSIWRFSHFPMNYGNVWFLDTGGGWEGKLTVMRVDVDDVDGEPAREFWQSELVSQLYPNDRGRG